MKDYIFTQNREILKALISQYNEIGIVISENHTLDNVGGALGLYLALQAAAKNVQVVSKKQPIVEISHLVGVDRIRQQFDGLIHTLTVSIPRRGKAIQKVSYNIEGDFVNLNIIAGEEGLNFSEDEVKYVKKGSSPSLIFAINLPSFGALQEFVTLDGNVRIVNIDNDPANQMYGDAVLVDPGFASISAVVTRLIEELTLPLDIDIAQNLMDGVVSATRNFTSQSSDSYSFEAASVLMRNGAVRKQGNYSQVTQGNSDFLENPQFKKPSVDMEVSSEVKPNVTIPQQPFYEQKSSVGRVPEPYQQSDNGLNDNINQSEADKVSAVPNDWFTPKVFTGSTNKQDSGQ